MIAKRTTLLILVVLSVASAMRTKPTVQLVHSKEQDAGDFEISKATANSVNPTTNPDEKFCAGLTQCDGHPKCESDVFGLCVAKGEQIVSPDRGRYQHAFHLGLYDIQAEEVTVTKGIDRSTEKVKALYKSNVVEVIKVEYVEKDTRIRAEIRKPPGWMSLVDTSDDYIWVLSRDAFCKTHTPTACKSEQKCSVDGDKCVPETDEMFCARVWSCTYYSKCQSDVFNFCVAKTEDAQIVSAKSGRFQHAFHLGIYDVITEANVGETEDFESESVGYLYPGHVVEVLQVKYIESCTRIRAEIKDPRGWISLVDTSDDYIWAKNRVEFCKTHSKAFCWKEAKCTLDGDKCLPKAVPGTNETTMVKDPSSLPTEHPPADRPSASDRRAWIKQNSNPARRTTTTTTKIVNTATSTTTTSIDALPTMETTSTTTTTEKSSCSKRCITGITFVLAMMAV